MLTIRSLGSVTGFIGGCQHGYLSLCHTMGFFQECQPQPSEFHAAGTAGPGGHCQQGAN